MGANNSSSVDDEEAVPDLHTQQDATAREASAHKDPRSLDADSTASHTKKSTSPSPITCSGWVTTHFSDTWSSSNVTYVDALTIPAPLPHQVCVKVYAAGVHPFDAQRTISKPVCCTADKPIMCVDYSSVVSTRSGTTAHDSNDANKVISNKSEYGKDRTDENKNTNNGSSSINKNNPDMNDQNNNAIHSNISHKQDKNENTTSILLPSSGNLPFVLGMQGAGVVVAVGPTADAADQTASSDTALREQQQQLRVGDYVMFYADMSQHHGGSFAQYAVMSEDVVCKIPHTLPEGDTGCTSLTKKSDDSSGTVTVPANAPLIDLATAATLPIAAQGAYLALFDKLRIEREHSIFISDASHGVGAVAVQMAHYYGLFVLASCPAAHLSYVRDLGADVVLNNADGDVDVACEVRRYTNSYGVDYVLDTGDVLLTERHASILRFGGSICVLSGVLIPTSDDLYKRQISVHYIATGMMQRYPCAREQMRQLGSWVLRLYLEGTFQMNLKEVPFRRAQEALDAVMHGYTLGDLVLTEFHVTEDRNTGTLIDSDRAQREGMGVPKY